MTICARGQHGILHFGQISSGVNTALGKCRSEGVAWGEKLLRRLERGGRVQEEPEQRFRTAHPWIPLLPQVSPQTILPTLLPRGSLPILATCSAFFTSCSARVLNRLDVYLYILGDRWVTSGPNYQGSRAARVLVAQPMSQSRVSFSKKTQFPTPLALCLLLHLRKAASLY